jgi:hypothetical protein
MRNRIISKTRNAVLFTDGFLSAVFTPTIFLTVAKSVFWIPLKECRKRNAVIVIIRLIQSTKRIFFLFLRNLDDQKTM